MNLFVHGIIPDATMNSLHTSAGTAELPSEVKVTFKQSAQSTKAGLGMVIEFNGGKAVQIRQVYDWWKAAVIDAGFRTDLSKIGGVR
ncbi:hypothetical protein [Deinococcus sp. UYEF24]